MRTRNSPPMNYQRGRQAHANAANELPLSRQQCGGEDDDRDEDGVKRHTSHSQFDRESKRLGDAPGLRAAAGRTERRCLENFADIADARIVDHVIDQRL